MRWAFTALVILGVGAAVCAAVLMVSFQASGAEPESEAQVVYVERDVPLPTRVVVAARDLDALTLVIEDAIEVREVSQQAAPTDAFADPIQIIGRLLRTPLTRGQAVTHDALFADGATAELLTALDPGHRAVSLSLSDDMGVESLLEPGCLVDVLATMTARDGDDLPVSLTLLEGARVLAIGDRTITNPDGDPSLRSRGPIMGRPTVTLLVAASEAEKLTLAMQEGSVTLALRNPADVGTLSTPGTQLASLSPLLAQPASAPPPSATPSGPAEPLAPAWNTVVLKGGVAQVHSFAVPATNGYRR